MQLSRQQWAIGIYAYSVTDIRYIRGAVYQCVQRRKLKWPVFLSSSSCCGDDACRRTTIHPFSAQMILYPFVKRLRIKERNGAV